MSSDIGSLIVHGGVGVTGAVHCDGVFSTSDQRLKQVFKNYRIPVVYCVPCDHAPTHGVILMSRTWEFWHSQCQRLSQTVYT